jgi:very-short-patch-repair endonuclease
MPLVRKSTLTRRRALNRPLAEKRRTATTDAERALWFLLRDRRIPVRFRRQHAIGPYVVDFFCPAAGLVIELDGEQHETNRAHDDIRTRFLEMRGYHVLRFGDHDIRQDSRRVLAFILHTASGRLRSRDA